MATYTSHLNLKLPDYSDTADINDLNNNFKKIDDAIASGGTGGGTGGGIVTETDPTVPSWAKQPSKPTYTAAEVGALPDTTVIPTVPSALPNPQPIVINGISYDGSERKEITVSAGDGGSITETDPTVPAWAKAENKPSYTAEEVGALPSTYKPPVTSVNGKTGAVSLVASDVGALPNTTVIPTVPNALKNPYPLTINGVSYDGSEAKTVTIESTGGGASVELDTTLTQYGKAADAGAVGNAIAQETAAREAAVNSLNQANAAQDTRLSALEQAGGIVTVEPTEDDIPKIYFTGTTPTTKGQGALRLFCRYISKTAKKEKYVTLKVQGDSSASYPKKNFTMTIYADSSYAEKENLTFKGWPAMNKFVLKAHWMDHSHVRNVGTAKIWGKIVASRSDYASLPEELRTSANNGATDGFTCKVFVNGVYQGLYELIVPKYKLFGQTTGVATHSILNSEQNNQATCAFATTSPTISGNWSEELQDSMSANVSTSFANFIKFVAGSTDEEFVANAETYFDVQSVIDFDIFARVFCIVDNLCKNQIFYTYNGVKWYEGAWDLDGVLGNPPTVRGYFAYNTAFQTGYVAYKDHGITNLLYERVETLFMDRFKARYAELRADILSADNIVDVYERLTDVITTYDGLLEEDYASTTGGGAFTDMPYKTENTIQQIRNFVAARLPYMDEQVEAIAPPAEQIPCTGITLDQTTLTFTAAGKQTLTATVTPSDTTDTVVWSTDANTVATVSGGVVTAVGNGSATITATCGAHSATCAVSVSGIGAVDPDGIDYTLNPLADVTWSDGYMYDATTGELKTANNEHATSKFKLQNCLYNLNTGSTLYPSLYIWDNDGNYVGMWEKPTLVWGNDKYTYAFKAGSTEASVSNLITFMPYDNSDTYERASIDLSTAGFTATSKAVELVLNDYVTNINNIRSVNYPATNSSQVYGPADGKKRLLQLFVSSGSRLLNVSGFGTDVDAVKAYYAGKEPLTFS